mmetsp:Transcript_14360/g.23755  ORF Transcript_14360/g.23755 Transcript_14360/m.23755 type:complete len:92 (-) Transcript_14360:26-301(-)
MENPDNKKNIGISVEPNKSITASLLNRKQWKTCRQNYPRRDEKTYQCRVTNIKDECATIIHTAHTPRKPVCSDISTPVMVVILVRSVECLA